MTPAQRKTKGQKEWAMRHNKQRKNQAPRIERAAERKVRQESRKVCRDWSER